MLTQECCFVRSAPSRVEKVNRRALSSARTLATHRVLCAILSRSQWTCSYAEPASPARPTALASMTQVTTGTNVLGTSAKLRTATIIFALSVCLSVRPSAPLSAGQIFLKFNICVFFENLSWKFKCYYNPTQVTGALNEDICTFMVIYRCILFRMRII